MGYSKVSDFIITYKDNKLEIEHKEFSSYSSNINRNELIRMLHAEIDGKEPHLWSDYDYEEPSSIIYFYQNNNKYVLVDSIDSLVSALHGDKYREFTKVEYEDSLI